MFIAYKLLCYCTTPTGSNVIFVYFLPVVHFDTEVPLLFMLRLAEASKVLLRCDF